MKVVANREKLAQAVQLASAICPSRSSRPILENLLLECADGVATLMATDLEVGIRLEVPEMEVEVPGKALLAARLMSAVLREITDSEMRLESNGEKLLVLGTNFEYQFPTADPLEYPLVPNCEGQAYHSFTSRVLKEMLSRTEFAVEVDSTRYNLGGVYFELLEESAIAVATDGRRLAKQEGAARQVGDHHPEEHVIIPARAVQLMQKILTDGDEEVKMTVEEGLVFLRTQGTVFSARLLDARFPRWKDVFPKEREVIRVELPVGAFTTATRQAAIVVDAKHPGLWLTFTPGKLILATHGTEYGESRVEFPINFDGNEMTVRLDPRFMLEFLKVLDSNGTFTWKIWSPTAPLLAETDDGYAYVLMPLAV